MDRISFSYNASGISSPVIDSLCKRLTSYANYVSNQQSQGYETVYASLHAPSDEKIFELIDRCIESKKRLQPTMLVIIGIGGSNLATMAVVQALRGVLFNELQPVTKIYFADTVDSDNTVDLLELIARELKRGGVVLLNCISKSGTTIETNLNFQLYAQVLKRHYGAEYQQYIVVTSDRGSDFDKVAQQFGFDFLPIPNAVGGRFSVFTSVALFPLGLLGFDYKQLVAGVPQLIEQSLSDVHQGPALHAALMYAWYQQGVTIDNHFFFSTDLHGIGLWYRQLIAESLGKTTGERRVGIVPLVSMGTVDLHSMVQLYLAGQKALFTTFVQIDHPKTAVILEQDALGQQLTSGVGQLSYNRVMRAILAGTQAAYAQQKLPYCSITLADKSEYTIGQFLQWNMLKIIYLSALLEVDPFDQPQVEIYKQQTRRILADE